MSFQSCRISWSRPALASQSGFGLVELMVSLAIGLVIIAAMVALFMGTSRNNREMATANSVIENGRFAIELLENDVVHGGFWGTHVPEFDNQIFSDIPTDVPAAIPDPCVAFDPADWDDGYVDAVIGIPVQTFDEDTIVADTTCDATGAVELANLQPDSDLLVVRHAELCVPGPADGDGCDALAEDGEFYVQSSMCTDDVVRRVADTWDAGDPGKFPLLQRNCVDEADLRKFVSSLYYIRNYAETAGDGIPTLVRSDFELVAGDLTHQAAVPLIEGIEAMRVELGIDDLSVTGAAVDYAQAVNWVDDPDDPTDDHTAATNRGDGVPDGDFIRCDVDDLCTAGDLTNVTSVRIHVLARSREPTRGFTDTKTYDLGGTAFGPFDDEFKRHVYTTTIRLPNVAGRRERP